MWLRFKDAVTGVRSTGKKPGLTTEASLLKMLQSMAPAEGSFVEITNFRGEKVTLTTTADGFELTFPRSRSGSSCRQGGQGLDRQVFNAGPVFDVRGNCHGCVPRVSHGLRARWDIPAEEPITRTLEETLDEFDRLSDTEGNFLGICLPGGGVVQFIYDDEEGLTIDVPQPETAGR